MAAGRRFARLATRAVVANPALWRFFRGALRAQFDRLAGGWEEGRGPDFLVPLEAALERLDREPRRVLDLGTGTGKAARTIAKRFSGAEVVGVDLSAEMIAEAGRLLPEDLSGRVRFMVADASKLPFEARSFDLVVLLNMIPFFTEIARVASADGTILVVNSYGAGTPIFVAPTTLRERFGALGFDRFEEMEVGEGTALMVRRSGA